MPPKLSAGKAQEKVEAELRKLTRLEGNKTCVDCPEKMPGYANLTHHTFVCTRCSGIHRELQFKIKGISMSVFTAEDVADMAATGNAAFNSVWLARFKDSTAPNGSDVTKLREFIKSKYVDRKWLDDRSGNGKMNGNGASSNSNSYDRDRNSQERSAEHSAGSDPGDLWGKKQSSTSRSTPLPKEPPLKVAQATVADSFGLDLLNLDNSPPPVPTKTQANFSNHQFNSTDNNFDSFGGAQTGGLDAFGGKLSAGGNGGFDAFSDSQPSSTFDPFSSSPKNQAAGFNGGGFDAFNSPPLNKSAALQAQLGLSDFNGFSSSAPIPFIKVSPPTAEEKAAEDALTAALSATAIANTPPPPKNFNAFDEIVPVMRGGPGGYGPPGGYPGPPPGAYGAQPGNPFDAPGGGAPHPFGQPHAYSGPPGNPFGGPQSQPGPFQPAPQGFYPGMPPQAQGMPPHMPPHMPPQGPGMPYGFPPHGPPGPYGYAPQFPPQPHPQSHPFPPQQGYAPYGFNPNAPQGSSPTPYSAPQPVVVPREPPKPDPFSTVGGLGWGEVSKPTTYQPSANTISAPYQPNNNAASSTSPSQRQEGSGDQYRQQPVSPLDSSQTPNFYMNAAPSLPNSFSPPATTTAPTPPPQDSDNPFDMF